MEMILSVVLRIKPDDRLKVLTKGKFFPFPSFSGSFLYFVLTMVNEEFLHIVLRIVYFSLK